MPDVEIVEMAPRDGLQNEPGVIATADKIALVDALSEVGYRRIETTSFVSPKWVPQMADAAEVMAGITRKPGVRHSVLTPNLKGYARARDAGADEVAVFAAATEGFSQANLNCSVAESLERFAPIMEAARADHLPVRGYISCVTDCPFEGAVDPAAVARLTEALLAAGCFEVSLGDTIGKGVPETVARMLDACLSVAPVARLAGHFHDTNGRAIENIEMSLERGLRVFDASAGGLGGCPFAKGATGNVATEDVQALMDRKGLSTGLDARALARAAELARSLKRSGADV